MKELQNFNNNIYEFCVYLRDRMDNCAGSQLTDEFKEEFIMYCKDSHWRKKIFKGTDFSKTFMNVLREYRAEKLKEILKEKGFY